MSSSFQKLLESSKTDYVSMEPDADRFRIATAEFALRLYRSLDMDRDRNVVLAASSASLPLLSLLSMADGETRTEIKNALFLGDLDDNEIHSRSQFAFYRLNQNGRRHDQWRPHGIKNWELHPINLLVMKKSMVPPTIERWSDVRARRFNCYKNILHGFRFVKDFGDAQEMKALDGFLEKETNGDFSHAIRIANPSDCNMAMMSAMAYRGNFSNGYRVDVERLLLFNITPNKAIPYSFVCNEALREYAETDQCKILGMEYVWGSLTLYIFLPKPGHHLSEVENSLTAARLIELLKQAAMDRVHKKYSVRYEIPAFRIRQSHDLTNVFREKMGVPSLFDSSRINLNMLQSDKTERPTAMGAVFNHASIKVSKSYRGDLNRFARPLPEQVGPLTADESAEFIADHPFFYLIYDVRAQLFLFMGRFVNPSRED